MPQLQKILEISGESWMKGLTLQENIPIGGIFSKATNFDPFRRMGVQVPTATPTDRNSGVVNAASEFFISSIESGAPYVYAFGDNNKVFKVSLSNSIPEDVSAEVSGITTIRGTMKFKSKPVYANSTTVYIGAFPLLLASQSTILTGLTAADHIMQIGPDRNLYITNGNKVARITSVAGTAGNSTSYLTFEDDVTIRDLASDGKYLIILGDQNPNPSPGDFSTFRCFVAFWNMKSQDLTQIWEFEDRYSIGLEFLENEVLVVGANNFYTCNVDAALKPILPTLGESILSTDNPTAFTMPTSPRTIIKKNNSIALIGGGTKILGYGRIQGGLGKVFFDAYNVSTTTLAGLYFDGFDVWAGTEGKKLFEVLGGGTGATSTTIIAGIDFKTPYSFAFAKVVLDREMAGGASVKLSMKTANGDRTVLSLTTFDFATYGTDIQHIFYPNPAESTEDVPMFEDLTDITLVNTGASIRRFEIWGIPQSPTQVAY